MSAFDSLHPALQHHIVNHLGWRQLRPFQSAVIPHILAGKHVLVLAPTAGGKTEAALFPVISRMLTEDWVGLSVLYICPIKALLNNLDTRLHRYTELVGRRSALWHGDITQSSKKRVLKDPPDCLLTTPESLEGMLVSSRVDSQELFSRLKVVIVDEVHAFAGDDRGWHLLSVLERLARLTGSEPQRIGLSATVGNPEDLLDWLSCHCEGERAVIRPPGAVATASEVTVDYVGSLSNAATVISRLHRGEKRLVFVDSRSKAESLGSMLREQEIETFVTHSSLSPEERRTSEAAFATGNNCVIVATSALELGIDVGDLDRVIQIDAPGTIASFLQRMGRSGRRAGNARNCLFLATSDQAVVQCAAIVNLWKRGFIEPIIPPPKPFTIFAQQIMALVLQEGGLRPADWVNWIARIPAFRAMTGREADLIIASMLEKGILHLADGILWFGEAGEKLFGKKNFLELLSVFTSSPLFTILNGREEIGYVDQLSFAQTTPGDLILSLGGRPWKVTHIDWSRRVAFVEAVISRGRSLWSGDERSIGSELSHEYRAILTGDGVEAEWSRRTQEKIRQIREEFEFLDPERSTVVDCSDGTLEWWTFGGTRANMALRFWLSASGVRSQANAYRVSLAWSRSWEELKQEIASRGDLGCNFGDTSKEEARSKFDSCLPSELRAEMITERELDQERAAPLLDSPVLVYHPAE